MIKSILITGAGRGLGRAVAELFAGKGYYVIATDINESYLDGLNDTGQYLKLRMDVTDPGSVQEAYDTVRQRAVKLNVLVNNAGIHEFFPLSEADIVLTKHIFDINTFGPSLVVRTFLPLLLRDRGRVINISSESVRLPGLFQPYQITKIALEAYTATIRQELALKDVRVILIRAGAMKTDLLNGVSRITNPVKDSVFKEEFARFAAMALAMVPRAVPPARVARTVLKAAESPHPKNIYNVNTSLSVRLLSYLPSKWFNRFLKKKLSAKKDVKA
jgi:NAD(P)-dependent dehydrogenase (short-subunit alcohol dehydrogenase family)